MVKAGVELNEIGFDFAGLHEMDAGEKDAVDVEQGFHGGFLFEKMPLAGCEMEVVIAVMASDAAAGDGF